MTARIPVIIDTDPGVDDAIALLLAFASDELQILAITCVAGNVDADLTALNARKIAAAAGRYDVPVHRGCEAPLLVPALRGKYHGAGGLGGTLLPEPPQPLALEHSVDALLRCARNAAASGQQITLVTLGPFTNVALALAHSPAVMRSGIARIVAMGGAFHVGGNRAPVAEFNVLADPHAADIVFRAGIPIVLAPLDLTFQALATPARVAALRRRGGRTAVLAADLISFYDRNDPARYGQAGGPLHDPCTIAYLLRPELFRGRQGFVRIETSGDVTRGQTVGDFWNLTGCPANADVLLGLDDGGFFTFLWDRIARLDEGTARHTPPVGT